MEAKTGERPVALVTGSSSGIGSAIALHAASAGYDVAANGTRDASLVEPLLGALRDRGARCRYFQADISTKDGRRSLLDGVISTFGAVDALVNNAGVSPRQRKDVLEMTEESYDRVMSVNLKGPLFLTQAFAKMMIEALGTGREHAPKIINISSISAYASSPDRAEYCLSKAGMSMMSRIFADRLAVHGIGVFEIRPGIIRTPMTKPVEDKYDSLIKGGLTPIVRWGKPEDVAKAVVAILRGYFPFSTGETFNVDGGFNVRRL